MNRIFITGDCHGDYRKLNSGAFPIGKDLTKDDYVIICGDFAFWADTKEQKYWLDWLENKSFTVLWIDGNHENFDLLKTIPVEKWHGGKVQFIRPSVIHLMRGQVFSIAGKSFFTFGGAKSHDIKDGILENDDPLLKEKMRQLDKRNALYRINHESWWKEELPSTEEMQEGMSTLEACNWQVDYILTHCCSSICQDMQEKRSYDNDYLSYYLSILRERCQFRHWFFGHYHEDKEWTEKETCLYHHIVELTESGHERYLAPVQFTKGDSVRFFDRNRAGKQTEYAGVIISVNLGGSILFDGPAATIRTADKHTHKNIPFSHIKKAQAKTDQPESLA